MQCDLFDAGRCGSCELMGVPYPRQLEQIGATVAATLSRHVPADRWLAAVHGPQSQYRNKSKLVVGGRRGAPVFGIVGADKQVVDLIDCDLVEPGLRPSLLVIRDFVAELGLTPYDIARRTGELKNVQVTHSPDGELMVRFVLRSTGQLRRLAAAVPRLQELLPAVRVVSANLLPEHRAVLEGTAETVLTEQQTLPMRLGGVTLYLRPGGFFQTNTTIAGRLYAQARDWVARIRPDTVWDLYCGVGGFALNTVGPGFAPRRVIGIELSEPAVTAARISAAEIGSATEFEFLAGDVPELMDRLPDPDLVIVNPPRRGIGAVADWLERSAVRHVIYSSCNSASLAADLDRMPGWSVERAELFHMFPQTRHHEVLVQLGRR